MPSKKQRAAMKKQAKKVVSQAHLDRYEGDLYVSCAGVSKELLHFDRAGAFNCGGAIGWNGHMWCEKDGEIYDPTPHAPENEPLCRKDGSCVKFYKRYDAETERQVIANKLQFREDGIRENEETGGNFFRPYLNEEHYNRHHLMHPEPNRCFQNARAYQLANPDWELCCGAFGYRVDWFPRGGDPRVKKQLDNYLSQADKYDYISLDYGY